MTNKIYIQVEFINTIAGQNDVLIALLADIGYSGFEEEDNNLKAFIDEDAFSLPG